MKQKGFVLVVAVIFLAILSILGMFMFGGFISDQQIAGNFREKSRALDAAQVALNSAQEWMTEPNTTYAGNSWDTGTACSAVINSSPYICSNALANPETLPWTSYVSFTPALMTVNAAGGSNTYADGTKYYIQYLGTVGTSPYSAMYQVTATAQGGNATAATVVQAVYQVTANSRDIGG